MTDIINSIIEKVGDSPMSGYINIELTGPLQVEGRAVVLRYLRQAYTHVHFSADEVTSNGVTKLILYCNPKPDY